MGEEDSKGMFGRSKEADRRRSSATSREGDAVPAEETREAPLTET